MGISFRYISYKILMNNKIDIGNISLVDSKDLSIDRITRIGEYCGAFDF